MILVTVEPDATREEILACLDYHNHSAMLVSRRGRVGTDSEHYKNLHDTIDYLSVKLDAFDKAPA